MIKRAISATRAKRATRLARYAFAGLLATFAALAPAQAQTLAPAGEPPAMRPVVIEMFTSQGCSSCPPADKLLAGIARRAGVFALSLPVDYWDYVGWKDTLALPYHARRQRHYAKVRGDSRVYTPQAVISGVEHVIGSDPAALLKAAEDCYTRHGALSVSIKVTPVDGGLRVELGASSGKGPREASLVVVRVAARKDVKIRRGENSGKLLTYVNVARGFSRVGEWSGEAAVFTIPRDQIVGDGADGWMIFLQAGEPNRPGVILAAAKSPGL